MTTVKSQTFTLKSNELSGQLAFDFDPNDNGGDFLKEIGLKMPESEALDYQLWLPNKSFHFYRNKNKMA